MQETYYSGEPGGENHSGYRQEGIPRIPLKNLRHTPLTLALESGVELLTVSRRAGHSSVSITANFYLRPHKQMDIDAASKLDDIL